MNHHQEIVVIAVVAVIVVAFLTRGVLMATIGGALAAAGAWLLQRAFAS
jgi:hypothetical protein